MTWQKDGKTEDNRQKDTVLTATISTLTVNPEDRMQRFRRSESAFVFLELKVNPGEDTRSQGTKTSEQVENQA